jgi:hypothetical protein
MYGNKYSMFLINPFVYSGGVPFVNTKSLLFDGVDEYVSLGSDSSLGITGAFTFSCWIKTTSTATDTILHKGTTIANSDYYLRKTATSGILYFLMNRSGSFAVSSTGRVDDGLWHHIAVVFIPSTSIKIYIDGVEDGSNTANVPASMDNTYTNGYIGTVAGASHYFNGNIDEPALFNSDKTAQISSFYNSGTPTDLSAESGLVSYWRNGDGDTYPTITDTIGVNNGTMTNMESGDIVTDTP